MQICHSSSAVATQPDSRIQAAMTALSETDLREIVEAVAIPRHYTHEADNNRRIANWIAAQLQSFGFHTTFQGSYDNVVALPVERNTDVVLVGAHYDSVQSTPGADDNASAVATLIACAGAIAKSALQPAVCFVAFNREEDGLLGSTDFVMNYLMDSGLKVTQAHILEMVGFCSHEHGSQHLPPALPIQISEVGDFLGLIANQNSVTLIDELLTQAKTYLPHLPVTGLKVPDGIEKYFPPLERSDHVPFWRAGIPAVMWTDTAEFRNPHYHQPSDTPETLDYSFLKSVTALLIAQVLNAPSGR